MSGSKALIGEGSPIERFRKSENTLVVIVRELLWVVIVVGAIALVLFLVSGTWPALVTIESESMAPHMNVGDLVFVVQADRYGHLQTWQEGKLTGYQKYEEYGDVIIYRPNGVSDFWSSIGFLILSKNHPIIHRAMDEVTAGQPLPVYVFYKGGSGTTPIDYIRMNVDGTNDKGYYVLYPVGTAPPENSTINQGIVINPGFTNQSYIIPSMYFDPDYGYIIPTDNTTSHAGLITKGDNNQISDQGQDFGRTDTGSIEPVEREWIVGKALFTIPYLGLIPLYIVPIAIVLIIIMIGWELYSRKKDLTRKKEQKKPGKKK